MGIGGTEQGVLVWAPCTMSQQVSMKRGCLFDISCDLHEMCGTGVS